MPHLIKLDQDGVSGLRLLAMLFREIPYPVKHGGSRHPQELRDRVHRQAERVQDYRQSLVPRRTAPGREARELVGALFALKALLSFNFSIFDNLGRLAFRA